MRVKQKHHKENYAGEITRMKIMSFVTDYYITNGVPPTLDEIVQAIDTISSKSTASYHMRTLVDRGDIRSIGVIGGSRRYIPANCHVVMDEKP